MSDQETQKKPRQRKPVSNEVKVKQALKRIYGENADYTLIVNNGGQAKLAESSAQVSSDKPAKKARGKAKAEEPVAEQAQPKPKKPRKKKEQQVAAEDSQQPLMTNYIFTKREEDPKFSTPKPVKKEKKKAEKKEVNWWDKLDQPFI
jgi:hypothetical protein